MKVTKKLTTTIIGEVTQNGIVKHSCRDFYGGKKAKKAFKQMQIDGFRVFIDSVKTEKVVIDMPDEYVFKAIADSLYRIEVVDNKESEEN